ncbi:MAG: hypothetical protein U1E28_14115 [Beijerinckiaceae bacterium]
MWKFIPGLALAGALALTGGSGAMAQQTNTSPGGGAQMNNAPSGDAMSDKSAPIKKGHAMKKKHRKAKKTTAM